MAAEELDGSELYIGAVDIVPAQKDIKYIDLLFENSVEGLKYILNYK